MKINGKVMYPDSCFRCGNRNRRNKVFHVDGASYRVCRECYARCFFKTKWIVDEAEKEAKYRLKRKLQKLGMEGQDLEDVMGRL